MSPLLMLLGIALVAGALVIVVLSIGLAPQGATGVARSLELINQKVTQREATKNELTSRDRLVNPALDRVKGLAMRLSPTGTTARLLKGLDKAGNPPAWTVERIYGAKGAAMIALGIVGLVYGGISFSGLLYGGGGALAGFFIPDLLLWNAGSKRKEQLSKGLADALDMLTVCVEAGQGFDSALLQVARSVDGPIAGEFARVLSEVQIGKSRAEAFGGLGQRVDSPEVKNFVSALVQADRLGLPVGAVLREQSNQMRIARRQKAEQKGHQVTVKILFPLLLCIFPALMIVIIGPGGIRMADAFGGM